MQITRRTLLTSAAAATLARATPAVSSPDDKFLEDLSRRSFQYFWEYSDPDTGLTRDRAHADGSPYAPDRRDIASIAATGFGLAGLCIAAERKWVKPEEANVDD